MSGSDRVFTPRRKPLLAAQLPATDTDAEQRRDSQAAALRAQIARLDKQQTAAQITALEDIVPDHPAAPPCALVSATDSPNSTPAHPGRSPPRSPHRRQATGCRPRHL